MVLIDSLYINNGGGRILLDYLVKRLEESQVSAFYIFDKRCEDAYLEVPLNRKVYMQASLLKRHKFYQDNIFKFTTVVCFGNLAPTVKLSIPVFTYFHQPMYLNIPKEFNFKEVLKFKLKQFIFSFLLKNTSKLLVQNNLMKKETVKRFRLNVEDVLCLPFYPNEDLNSFSSNREQNTFIYVSNATPHKNYIRLIDAFIKFYDKYKVGKLILTVDFSYTNVFNYIVKYCDQGYPLVNIGFVSREELIKYYHKSEYLIFPSLKESFGLGIVEAIECGCKVIGANLPYMYEVCVPSIQFDPKSIESIYEAFELAFEKKENTTKKLVNNEIDNLLKLISRV